MRLGIISDIHSNIEALVEVIKLMKKENVEKVICLGDIIGIGPYPEKCIEYLMENEEYFISCVKGNHEGYLINGITRHNHKDEKPMSNELILMHKHNHLRLNNQHKEYIKKIKDKDILFIETKKILVEHYHSNNEGEYKKFYKAPNLEEIQELYYETDADIYLFGHTHQSLYFENNNKYYINPGSLGCPKDKQGANCGILEINGKDVKYQQIEVEYNINKVICDIIDLNYKESDLIIKKHFKNSN